MLDVVFDDAGVVLPPRCDEGLQFVLSDFHLVVVLLFSDRLDVLLHLY